MPGNSLTMIQPCHFSGPWWKQEKNTSRKNCSRQRDYYLKNKEYHVHPEGWDKSYIGTFSALTNLLTYGDLNEDQISLAENNLQDLQEKFIKRFDTLSDQLRKEKSMEAREEIMTKADMEMAAQAHDLALALYRYFTYGEDSKLIKGIEKQ